MNSGFDRLSRDVLIASAALGILGVVIWRTTAGMILCALSTLLVVLILYRTLSKNVERRQDELIGYERIASAVSGFFSGLYSRLFKRGGAGAGGQSRDPAYKYFKCPKCKREYRAPKGKGRIRVTCRECGERFEKKV